jgi:hypothetical protein
MLPEAVASGAETWNLGFGTLQAAVAAETASAPAATVSTSSFRGLRISFRIWAPFVSIGEWLPSQGVVFGRCKASPRARRNEGFRQARARSMVALQWTNAECGLGVCGTDGG